MELDQDGPLTKWKSKMETDFNFNFCCLGVTGFRGNNAQRGEKTTPNYFYVPKSWGPESYRPIDRRDAAHCFNAAWRMAAASAVRHICLIDPESCLTNTCANVWTCEHDSSIFYSRTYLLTFYFHHTCTNAMDILHDCLQKVSLNKYVTSAQMLIEPAMWQFVIFFWTWILGPFRRFPIVQLMQVPQLWTRISRLHLKAPGTRC